MARVVEAGAPVTTESKSISTKRERLTQLLAERGYDHVTLGLPPAVTEIRHSGADLGRFKGRDVMSGRVYARASLNQPTACERLMRRGYAPMDPGADIRLEGCDGGSSDVFFVADAAAVQARAAEAANDRKARRGTSVTEHNVTRAATVRPVQIRLDDED